MIRSRKYLDGSRGATCKFRIPGVCNNDPETVVACHLRDGNFGIGRKASDLSTVDGCSSCHDVMDFRAQMPDGELIAMGEWLFYALRGLQETLEARVALGLLVVQEDKPAVRTIKPRKPRGERKSIQSRPFQKREVTK